MRLSILIPTLPQRSEMFQKLIDKLYFQLSKKEFTFNERIIRTEILANNTTHSEMSIGEKRNQLLSVAKGEYICFIDDDDDITDDYIETILEAINSRPDCLSLRGIITENGVNRAMFEHSIKYKAYATTNNEIKYERYPNHLNCIRSEIAKQFKFPEINHGEDTDWATQIFNSGLIKTEGYIPKVLYYYKYISNKKYT